MSRSLLSIVALLLACTTPSPHGAFAQDARGEEASRAAAGRNRPDETGAYDAPFFPDAHYDERIPTPEALLGFPHGSRLAHHAEILACFRAWDSASSRVTLEPYGHTHEDRELLVAVVTSPENHARLDEIRASLAKLADPRGLSDAEAERLISSTPPVAWMGYSIHGDELSGSDAALAFGYHLAASTDPDVLELLAEVVVVIDPCLNPDGRERIVAMVEQSSGSVPNLDYASMHRGRWPWGRGNHYLFDMNRDWMAGTQPETRGRWSAALSFHPQLFVDAHEMGSLDTFLFYPQAEPRNPNLPPKLAEWQARYAEGAARAFDARGWTYYTREWADAWGPFYSDAWGSLTGATGILYEQANTMGLSLLRASGRVLTYREAVHHQAIASLANVTTLAANARSALADFAAARAKNVAADTPGNERTFVVRPSGNALREEELLRLLISQEIEVFRSEQAFTAKNAVHADGTASASLELEAGALLVPARQPMGPMVHAYLDFDIRYDEAALQREREELERKGRSKAYDLTSWCLAHALDLDAWWCDEVAVETRRVASADEMRAPVASDPSAAASAVAWLVDGSDDASVGFAARAMELGLAVHVADETFMAAGRRFVRGSVLVRRNENEGTPEEIAERVNRAASEARVSVFASGTSRAPDAESADLGGQHFELLARPRIALVGNAPISPDSYGHLWHHLDRVVGVPCTLLDAQSLGGYDLRRYNVIVLPESFGGLASVLDPLKGQLGAWIESGGTLIACGDAAATLTKGRLGLSSVVLREDALGELASYAKAAARERGARSIHVDPQTVFDPPPPPSEPKPEHPPEPKPPTAEDDAWLRRFSPQGATVRGLIDPVHWVTAGVEDELAVLVSGPFAFLSKEPVRTPVRLAEAPRLRLAGLLWPEARHRLAESAWLSVESKGNGQIVLFAATPGFRGYHLATARLFANAVVLGPALGANQPHEW